ncbi:hypothetical protein GCM10027418_05990 [Mariniluteicoccus endophyticus]
MDAEPRRQLLDDEPTTVAFDEHDHGVSRPAALVRRFALPGILAASIAVGALGGTLTPARSDSTVVAAASAPSAVRAETPEVSRDTQRPEIDPSATPEAQQGTGLTEPQALAVAPAPASAAPSPEQKPAAAPSTQATATSTMYATETLNVRSAPSSSADKIATLAKGDRVSATDSTDNGFRKVVVDGRAGWASSEYLSRNAPTSTPSASTPAASPKSSSSAPKADSGSAPTTSGACSPLPGVRANTEKVHQAICAKFGSGVSSYIGVRPDWDVEHPSGRALDAMVSSNSTGWAIANYVRANASSLGVTEVIFDQKIWTTQRSSEGWRSMSDRGSTTANHRDHVHVSTR